MYSTITPTENEQAIITRNTEIFFTPYYTCLRCHCRLSRFIFGATACARCEPGALWSDELLRMLATVDGREEEG